MTGRDWPPLVPYPPGQEGKLPGILPKIPSSDKSSGSRDKVVTLEAGSLNSAYRLLEKHGLQPVPTGSTSFCKGSPKMRVFQDEEQLDWDLMRVAVPRCKGRVKEGMNKDDEALTGPLASSILCQGIQLDRQKTVTMAKKKGRKKMTPAKKKQLANRSLFCGPKKPKNKKKPKAGRKDTQSTAVPSKVNLRYLSLKYILICWLRNHLHLIHWRVRTIATRKSPPGEKARKSGQGKCLKLWIFWPR